jgi:hypothetical protein
MEATQPPEWMAAVRDITAFRGVAYGFFEWTLRWPARRRLRNNVSAATNKNLLVLKYRLGRNWSIIKYFRLFPAGTFTLN